LKAARSFLANATPLKADFVRRELPSDFLERLATAISNFEAVIDEGNRTKGAKVSARVAQDNDVGEGMSLSQEHCAKP
jgi:hypothetical protein